MGSRLPQRKPIVARFLRALLFGVAASDPLTLGGSALLLLAVAMLASWVPARRRRASIRQTHAGGVVAPRVSPSLRHWA